MRNRTLPDGQIQVAEISSYPIDNSSVATSENENKCTHHPLIAELRLQGYRERPMCFRRGKTSLGRDKWKS